MKIVGFDALSAILDLDPTDCLTLADACAFAAANDAAADRSHVTALRAALEACAVIAATDTLRDAKIPEEEMLADTRRVWGPKNMALRGTPRVEQRPK